MAEVTLDRTGRIVLPKTLREALGVEPGDRLHIERENDRLIVSAVRPQAVLQKQRGVVVYRSGSPANASIPKLIEQQRNRRSADLLGKGR